MSSKFDRADPGLDPDYADALTPVEDVTVDELIEELSQTIAELRAERVSVVSILDAFRQAPLTMSAVQPILDLAERLCPRDDGDPTPFPSDSRD